MKCWIICLASLMAAAQGFVQIGKEFKYDIEVRIGSGTMDHSATASATIYRFKGRMQHPSKDIYKSEISDMKYALYNGPWNTQADTDFLTFLPVEAMTSIPFQVTLENGHFKSLSTPPGLSFNQKNIIKAWVSACQLDTSEIVKGKNNFKIQEETINGLCDVSYTVTSSAVYKSLNVDKDCKNPVQRKIDDIGGYDCNYKDKDKPDDLVSISNTAFEFEGKGSERKLTKLSSRETFVANMFGSEGISFLSRVNITAVLTSEGPDPGDISGGSDTITSLKYEFADNDYKWNQDRNLKDSEPYLSSGIFFENQAEAKAAFLKGLKDQEKILHSHEYNSEEVQRAHSKGIDNLILPLTTLDYDNLRSIYDDLSKDLSTNGKRMSNIFTELLGSCGTTASAVLVMDLLKEKKFDNQRDATRAITSIPFHIRRSNKQLVKQFKELLDTDQEEMVKNALPLVYAHLVRKTCETAGHSIKDPEVRECAMDIGKETGKYFYDKFEGTDDRTSKNLYLAAMRNLKWGGGSMLLKELILGKTGEHPEHRVSAIWAALGEVAHAGKGFEYFLPVFAEKKNDHEVRMAAFYAIMMLRPSTTEVAKITNVLYNEKDIEVINGVFSHLEMKAGSISPCDRKVREIASFFLKFLKQFSMYNVDYGLGITKSYTRQFAQKKYGYGGSSFFYVNGAHESTTPLSLGMGMNAYTHSNYKVNVFIVHLRIEGLAKEIVKRFKSNDPSLWKTADLKSILSGMGIKERPDQPLRVSVTVMFKGIIVIERAYDESSIQEGKFDDLIEKMKEFKGDFVINHQRVLNGAKLVAERPNIIGLPTVFFYSGSIMLDLQAKLKPGKKRAVFFTELEYDMHGFTQIRTGMLVMNLDTKIIHGIRQNRIYHIHLPRKVSVGLNIAKRSAKIKISRAQYEEPTMLAIHSQTDAFLRDGTTMDPNGAAGLLQKSCPNCKPNVVLTNGEVRDREIVNRDNSKYGYRIEAKYFDCEMDVSRSTAVGGLLRAFMPYNKNPKTPWTILTMGVRQVTAYLFHYPRAEKCGIIAKFSQSSQNPVREIEIELSGERTGTKERIFLRGGQTKMSVTLKAIGDQTRAYRLNVLRQTSPGDLMISTMIKFDRAANANLGIKPYVICVEYKAKYPGFGKEMFNVDMNTDMSMKGEAKLNYGETADCEAAEGSIKAKFQYFTTNEARENLKNKWYYKDCMERKNSEAWQGRNALPIGHSCYLTAYDASNARKYKYHIKFDKLTDRAKSIIENIRSAVRTFVLPYTDLENDNTSGDIGPFVTLEATLKDDDKVADLSIETSQGTKKINDYPLRLTWSRRLRNLKFTKTRERLIQMGLVKTCQFTSKYVQTMDNVTYPLEAPSCWTLMSGHCNSDPSYAVFVKKDSGMPVAMKAYIGGHEVDIDAKAGTAKVNGGDVTVNDKKEFKFIRANVEVFKITKWGSTFNIYSYMRVWIMFDGNFVNVVPAPSVKGQHCGLCGNYNRNMFDEAIGKDGETDVGFSGIADEWKYQC